MPRLRRSDPGRPGIARRRRGGGFGYAWSLTGAPVSDPATLERIGALAIPPAWQDVWICPDENGHIQAVGTDAAGRRQYLYHQAWRKRRDAQKFARALDFGRVLPDLRRAVAADLRRHALDQRRVAAAAVRLLDVGCFRIGSEVYARDNETFGIATLLRQHLKITNDELVFSYPAKGSIPRVLRVSDRAVAEVMVPLRRRRGGSGQLLAYRSDSGWVDLHSSDINRYLKETAGPEFSAKDFRTWSGTVHAAIELSLVHPRPASATARKRATAAAVRSVAEHLGNTPAVCRASYINPRLFDLFDEGVTLAELGWPGSGGGAEKARAAAERLLISLLAGPSEEAAA